MRILLVTHYYPEHGGGIEIVAGELARRLGRRGVEVVWAASEPAGPTADEGVTRLPMRAWNVTERRLGFPYPLWSPESLLRMVGALERCDLVHIHDCLYLGNVLAGGYAGWRQLPTVVTQHIGMVPYSRAMLRWMLAGANLTLGRLVLGGCTQTVFVSTRVRDYFADFVRFRRPPLFLPNGVSTGVFRPLPDGERRRIRAGLGWAADRLVFLFVGRFVEKKGLLLLRGLARSFPHCDWVFVGWGPDDPASWDLPNARCVGRLGHREMPAYYQAADLLVLPSVGEGFPLVVQESMACGTPALISAETAQGMPGVETAAYVAEPRAEDLDAVVGRIVAEPTRLRARREVVARFAHARWDWDACAERYRELFEAVLRGSS